MTLVDQIAGLYASGNTFPIRVKTSFLGFPYMQRHGWLWIEDKGDLWVVSVMSAQHTHNPRWGTGYVVDFMKADGEPTHAYKTVLSLWLIHDPEKAKNVFAFVEKRVRLVYDAVAAKTAQADASAQEHQQRNKAL